MARRLCGVRVEALTLFLQGGRFFYWVVGYGLWVEGYGLWWTDGDLLSGGIDAG